MCHWVHSPWFRVTKSRLTRIQNASYEPGRAGDPVAVTGIVIAVAVNSQVKGGMATVIGGRHMGCELAYCC